MLPHAARECRRCGEEDLVVEVEPHGHVTMAAAGVLSVPLLEVLRQAGPALGLGGRGHCLGPTTEGGPGSNMSYTSEEAQQAAGGSIARLRQSKRRGVHPFASQTSLPFLATASRPPARRPATADW